MRSTIRYCTACGGSDGGTARQFCTACGAPTPRATVTPAPAAAPPTPVRTPPPAAARPQAPTPVRTYTPAPFVAEQAPQPRYSTTVINAIRLLGALCMLSGIVAVARFDSSTSTGRKLIFTSVLTAMCGQIFIHQAGKSEPPAWTGTALLMFWLGLVGLGILWLVALQ